MPFHAGKKALTLNQLAGAWATMLQEKRKRKRLIKMYRHIPKITLNGTVMIINILSTKGVLER
jgi:hypothetical protein